MKDLYKGYRLGFVAKYSGPTNYKGATYNCRYERFGKTERFKVPYDYQGGMHGSICEAVRRWESKVNSDNSEYVIKVTGWYLSELSDSEYFVTLDHDFSIKKGESND